MSKLFNDDVFDEDYKKRRDQEWRERGYEAYRPKERDYIEPKPSMFRAPSPVRRDPSPIAHHRTQLPERAPSAERKRSARARSPSARPVNGRFVPDNLPVRERRARSAARSPEGTYAPPIERRSPPPRSNFSMMQRAPTMRPPSVEQRIDRYERKHEPLREIQKDHPVPVTRPSSTVYIDDPYKPPTYYGKCQYCNEINANFAKQFVLENHYAEHCKMMNSCRYCHKVVLISQLTDHYISRCDFLRDKKVRCSKCGLATEREDDEADVEHPLCRGRPPPSGAKWCPLCAVAVDNSKENWIKHTASDRGCYNNPRKSKVPGNVKTSLVPEHLFLTTRPKSTVPGSNPERGSAYGPRSDPGFQSYKVPDAAYHGPKHDMRGRRLIDADELLSALKIANARKMAQKKKKEELRNRGANED